MLDSSVTSTQLRGMVPRLLFALVWCASSIGAEYDGACDDQTPDWLEYYALEEQPSGFDAVYMSEYSGSACGTRHSVGVSMNYQHMNCGTSPDGQGSICLRCVDGGTLAVALYAYPTDTVFDHASDGTDETFLAEASAYQLVSCDDGCGDTCYELGDDVSFRLGFHSADPLCEESHPNVTCATALADVVAGAAPRRPTSGLLGLPLLLGFSRRY